MLDECDDTKAMEMINMIIIIIMIMILRSYLL